MYRGRKKKKIEEWDYFGKEGRFDGMFAAEKPFVCAQLSSLLCANSQISGSNDRKIIRVVLARFWKRFWVIIFMICTTRRVSSSFISSPKRGPRRKKMNDLAFRSPFKLYSRLLYFLYFIEWYSPVLLHAWVVLVEGTGGRLPKRPQAVRQWRFLAEVK